VTGEPERLPDHAHAVMHVNQNVRDMDAALAFHQGLCGSTIRMRQVSTDNDGGSLGIAGSTASLTVFLYDSRGPRSAPSVELVRWDDPVTRPLSALPDDARGLVSLGYRTANPLEQVESGAEGGQDDDAVTVRGRAVPVRRLTDPDGTRVELVQADPQSGDSEDSDSVYFSHARIGVTDVDVAVEWYRTLGFVQLAEVETRPVVEAAADRGHERASLVLPEDPTFSLELEQRSGAAPERDAATQGVHRMALAVDDVREAHAALVRRPGMTGVPAPTFIPMPDVPTGGFTVLFMTAPDGEVVEFVERPRSEMARPTGPVLSRYLPT
jgi:catechol 2,3-dioxygenase-like lactoylglutathione lyase family enzyme